jgi:hypothetical protein
MKASLPLSWQAQLPRKSGSLSVVGYDYPGVYSDGEGMTYLFVDRYGTMWRVGWDRSTPVGDRKFLVYGGVQSQINPDETMLVLCHCEDDE